MASTLSEGKKVSADREPRGKIVKEPKAVNRRWLFTVAWSGFAAVALYASATVLGGILDSSYSHLRHPVSELISSHAPNRGLLGGIFTAYNIALMLFGLGIHLTVRRSRAVSVAFAFIATIALGGILMVAPFPQDSLGHPATAAGGVHITLAYVVSPLTVATAFLLGFAFRRDPSWRGVSRSSFALAFVILGTGAITGIAHAGDSRFLGLFERVTIGAFLVWILVVSTHALVGARAGGGRLARRRARVSVGATSRNPAQRRLNGLYVHESGIPGSPAIVFLHGVGVSGTMWSGHMGRLPRYHCLAPDLPGFGRSNRVPWETRIDTAERVAELIETRIPARRAHVVGLSLGGSVAHALLARRPDVLDRVVIDGSGVLPWWGTGLVKLGVAMVSPFLHTRLVTGAIGRAFGLDEESRADLLVASRRSFRRAFADANDTRISREELSASCPTLLVAGEREMKPLRASNAALAALMPDAQARFVPGLGHGWLGVEPDLHVSMVAAWITGQELPTGLLSESTAWPSTSLPHLLESR